MLDLFHVVKMRVIAKVIMMVVIMIANTVRYLLKKEGKRILYVIGINPSTANETKPDRTLGRVMGFAEENGFDGFAMVNLYPQRSTRPYNLHQELCVEMHKNNLSVIKELFLETLDIHSMHEKILLEILIFSNI